MPTIGPFRLDQDTQTLFLADEPLTVGKRAVAVLGALVEHLGRPVSKDALLTAAWNGMAVEESNLAVQIAALRKALGRVPGGASWIETLPRRGYRLVGPPSCTEAAAASTQPSGILGLREGDANACRVGRAGPLAALDQLVARARSGQRQLLFVTGEAGIGKTTFIDMALERLGSQTRPEVLLGHCTERFGTDEAFSPLIDALTQRCRAPGGAEIVKLIREHAPTWMLQLPQLLDGGEAGSFQKEVFGATRERMLREFCDLLAMLSKDRLWVLVVEDLHWSDPATLDVLSRLARDMRTAQMLLIASYRLGSGAPPGQPVRRLHQDLEIHGRCAELRLDHLEPSEVERYLTLRFRYPALAASLSGPIFARSQGQPLFVSSFVEYLVNQQAIVEEQGAWRLASPAASLEDVVPGDLANMITHEISRLTPQEQRLLEVAAIAGTDFPAALVAAGLEQDTSELEEALELLAFQSHALSSRNVVQWPDGTLSTSFAFNHILYQNVLYERVAAGRRAQIHRRMAQRLRTAHDGCTAPVAPELALHFEQALDIQNALHFLGEAAKDSISRLCYGDAIAYATRALQLLDRYARDGATEARMALLRLRSWARRSLGDLAGSVSDLNDLIAAAAALGQHREEVSGLLAVSRFCMHADRRLSLAASEAAFDKSQTLSEPAQRTLVQGTCASNNLYLKGWSDADAALCEQAICAAAAARDFGTLIRRLGIEGIVNCWRSNYEACVANGTNGKKIAREVGDVYVYVLFNILESTALLHLGEWRRLIAETRPALAMAEKNANRPAKALCQLTLAWLSVEAMDFEGAVALCEIGEDIAAENTFAYFFQRAVLAKAFVGLGDVGRAAQEFAEIEKRVAADGMHIDFTIYTQLYHCYGEYCLLIGDIAQARQRFQQLHDYVATAPDRNHLAIAYALAARICLASGDTAGARANIGLALETIGNADFPLAAWRVHRAAAAVFQNCGEPEKAQEYQARYQGVLLKLTANFEPTDRLYRSLMRQITAELPAVSPRPRSSGASDPELN